MMTAASVVDPAVVALLRDAAAWRLIGRLFECPSPEWCADLEALASEVDDEELRTAAAAARREGTEGQYHSVFGPGGPAPPREVSYHDSLELGSVMSSVTGYYHAFGYAPAVPESPDHVAVEAGFLAYLRFKQAFALADLNPDHADVAARAAARFQEQHLAVYAERLGDLLSASPLEYLQIASRVLAARVGPQPGPRQLIVFTDVVDDEGGQFACDQ